MNVKLTKTKTVCIVQKFSGNECIFCVILNSEKTSQNFLDSQALRYLANGHRPRAEIADSAGYKSIT